MRAPGRREDERLVTGAGRYTADGQDGASVARFVRSPVAHARIARLDLQAARDMPGVLAVLAADDLRPVLPRIPGPLDTVRDRDGGETPVPGRPALAVDRVRFAGEAVALVVAETAAEAADAAEAVAVEYDELSAVSSLDLDASGEPLHDELPSNLAFDWEGGDGSAAERAFAAAAHVVSARVRLPRILGMPLEPVSATASFDESCGRWTLTAPTQGAHRVRDELADGYLAVPRDRLRVVTPDVGGAFGIRIHMLPEHAALLAATRLLGRPVSWVADRSESHLCEPHARDFLVDAELALDRDGRFLAVRASALCALGAYVHPAARATPTVSFLFGMQGPYRIGAAALRVRGFYTNTTPTGPFRGAGQPEGAYVLERLIDRAARRLGLSPTALRRRNAIGPAERSYRSATGHAVDSADAQGLLDRAAAWLKGQPAPDDGLLAGHGLALYLKVNGIGRQERAEVEVEAATGNVVVRIGSQSNGQGHETTFAHLAAERLGLDPARVQVVQGDTDLVAFGTGTGASSALGTTGTGVGRSCTDFLANARTAATALLGADADALAYDSGGFRALASNRFATLAEIAAAAPGGLVGRSEVEVGLTYTVGCHACAVAVDAETGAVRVTGYAAFDDLGPLLQPAIAEGQIHGGVAHGIGQALLEGVSYDGDGAQPLTTTFLDYGAPRADDLPSFLVAIAETPCEGTDLGVRGAGEAGAIASMAAVVNAVADALGTDEEIEAPLTPARVWRHLQRARPARERQREAPMDDAAAAADHMIPAL